MFGALVDRFRTHSTEWLERRHREVIDEQRKLHAEELALVRVLDERGRIDPTIGADGESARTVREKVETARALDALPAIGAVACEGGFSDEQLVQAARLADESSDAEWACRAPNIDPVELARLARRVATPSTEESRRRFESRELRMWWARDTGMLHLRGQLPDEMGDRFESTIQKLAEQMKPAKGEAWDSFGHRAADALVQLCDPVESAGVDVATLAASPNVQIAVPAHGPAEIAGIPIADSLLEQLRANATVEPVLVDDDGAPLAVGRRASVLSPKVRRAVLQRDGKCRVPGCARRQGLEVHHLVPRTWGGTDEIANLAVVCPAHHRLLVPHGVLALVGNPNFPDGLDLVVAADRGPPGRAA